jgi:hypothetical protein
MRLPSAQTISLCWRVRLLLLLLSQALPQRHSSLTWQRHLRRHCRSLLWDLHGRRWWKLCLVKLLLLLLFNMQLTNTVLWLLLLKVSGAGWC